MKTKHMILLILMLLVSSLTFAQSVVGFWKVDLVMVGERNVTPVAKWFHYHPDHTYQAGNGWSQNSIGTWAYDKKKAEFIPFSSNGEPDEFGAFKTCFENGKMYWEREEEGMKVVVTLSPTTEMPMSPKDSIAGTWNLVSVTKEGKDITPMENASKAAELHISWGGTYRKTAPDGASAHGFWHMDPHHPEFHLVDWNREVDFVAYHVSFDKDQVKMIPWKDETMIYTYVRKK